MAEALRSRCRRSEAMAMAIAKVERARAGHGRAAVLRIVICALAAGVGTWKPLFLAQGKCGTERVVPST